MEYCDSRRLGRTAPEPSVASAQVNLTSPSEQKASGLLGFLIPTFSRERDFIAELPTRAVASLVHVFARAIPYRKVKAGLLEERCMKIAALIDRLAMYPNPEATLGE